MEDWIKVAELGKPFALKGEVKAVSYTSFPEERFQKGRVFLLKRETENEGIYLTLESFRELPNSLLLSFKGIESPEEIEKYRGYSLYIKKEEAPLPEGYYRLEDLKGLTIFDQNNEEIGTVIDTMQNAPTLNLVAKAKDGHRFMVPFIDKKFILDIDLEKKTIHINVIPGLL